MTREQEEKIRTAYRAFINDLDHHLENTYYESDEVQAFIIAVTAKIDKLNGTLRGIGA